VAAAIVIPLGEHPWMEGKRRRRQPVKSFTSAAVFGLVPVPPTISATTPCAPAQPGNDCEKRAATEDLDNSELAAARPGDATERVATKDELARIRRQLATDNTE
jgi:hypothetical protein